MNFRDNVCLALLNSFFEYTTLSVIKAQPSLYQGNVGKSEFFQVNQEVGLLWKTMNKT